MKVIDPARGLYSGKAGGYVFYVRNGRTYARRANEPKDKDEYHPTEKQRRLNERFRIIQEMYRYYKRRISPDVWTIAARAEGRMAHNLFHSVNCACFDGEGRLVDHRHFRFSAGSLLLPRELAVTPEGGGWFGATWVDEREMATAAATDLLRVGVIYADKPLELHHAEEVEGTRGDGRGRFRLDPERCDGAHAYLYFARADGSAYSPSEHVEI